MMPGDKKLGRFLTLFTAELLCTYLIIAGINKRTILNSAWLSGRFYVFQFAAFYQIGFALIRAQESPPSALLFSILRPGRSL